MSVSQGGDLLRVYSCSDGVANRCRIKGCGGREFIRTLSPATNLIGLSPIRLYSDNITVLDIILRSND